MQKIFVILVLMIFTSNIYMSTAYGYDIAEEEMEEEIETQIEEEAEYQRRCEETLEVAYVVWAEAGNQDFIGKLLVANVIYNRVHNDKFPNTVDEVLRSPGQFNVMVNGQFEKAPYKFDMTSYAAAWMIFMDEEILDPNSLYFSRGKGPGSHHYKHMDHWFSY